MTFWIVLSSILLSVISFGFMPEGSSWRRITAAVFSYWAGAAFSYALHRWVS